MGPTWKATVWPSEVSLYDDSGKQPQIEFNDLEEFIEEKKYQTHDCPLRC